MVPVAQKLLELHLTEHIVFEGLSFAYTHQPFPTMIDGMTPGYASIQTGQVWWDASWPFWNNMVDAAVTMLGTQHCTLERCRIAHTGGSGVIVSTAVSMDPPLHYTESNHCQIVECEIFDIGAHGVYLGDERSIADSVQAPPGQSGAGSDPSNSLALRRSRIENFAVVYRDSVGVYAGHTRDLVIMNNEIAYGDYDGISVGTLQAHHLGVPAQTNVCGSPTPVPQVTVGFQSPPSGLGTVINGNDIHHVMLKLTDGGAIYMQGSHLPGSGGVPSQLLGNHIHDIVLNPYINIPFGPNGTQCRGFYFETGSDGWYVLSNYTARTQAPCIFNVGHSSRDGCAKVPAIWRCDGLGGSAPWWWMSVWPTPWNMCETSGPVVPGQHWVGDHLSNIWLDPVNLTGPYHTYAHCTGYGEPPPHALSSRGGMWALTSPQADFNHVVQSQSDPVHGTRIASIIATAGPHAYVPNWFFPAVTRRIHRTPICSEPVDPASQIQ